MYISTREMVISIICNACGVLGLILWAIEAHKSNANQHFQDVESVEPMQTDDIVVRSNLYPFRVVEADRKPENSSEKPNNCETCRFELYCPEMCEGCCEWDSHYEPKDEPQTKREGE